MTDDTGGFFTSEEDIANKLTENFSLVSSTDNYSDAFKTEKALAERLRTVYDEANDVVYNSDFLMDELKTALSKFMKKLLQGLTRYITGC